MKLKNIFLGALMVAAISILYNYIVFYVFDFYPDFMGGLGAYIVFGKNFFVGMILMILFTLGYREIESDKGGNRNTLHAVFYFSLYAIFAMVNFSIGDMFLMRSNEGMLILLTLDGWVETLIATIPVRMFASSR